MTISINQNLNNPKTPVSNGKTPVNNPNPQKQMAMIPTEDKPLSASVSKISPKGDVLEINDSNKNIEKIEKNRRADVKAVKPVKSASEVIQPETPIANSDEGLVVKSYKVVTRTSSLAKAVVDGVFSGLIFGTIVAGANMIYSGIKKFKNKEIKFVEMFNPKKAMSKLGRNISYGCAAGIMIGTIASAYLKANQNKSKR